MCCQIVSVNCISSNDNRSSSTTQPGLSQSLSTGDAKPAVSQTDSIFNSFFTKDGHFRIFDDLIEHRFYDDDFIDNITTINHDDEQQQQQQNDTIPLEPSIPLNVRQNTSTSNELLHGIQKYLLAYAEDALAKSSYELFGSKDVSCFQYV